VRILTVNLNGIRSAADKGFFTWLVRQQADIVCVQDLKARETEIPTAARQLDELQGYFHCALRKGYSGVGLYTWREPDQLQAGLGWPDIDAEGRYLQADFGRLSIVSVYVPSGSASAERQAVKMDFLRCFLPHLRALRASRRHVILCGDWNIAHTPKDLKNWCANQTHSGFLPEERAWLSRVFDELGWVDVFRHLKPDAEQYTWWSYRGQAWAKNIGWRIDYQIATPGIAARAQHTEVYTGDRFSDHAPLLINYDYAF
jgi:exodeoxyribonuclease-3